MSFWDVLGIEPTSDKGIIKEAYIKKLSLHHPEEDPEGFKVLREAYESALRVDLGEDNNFKDDIEKSLVQEWISKVNNLYNNFFERIDEDNWHRLLKEDVCYQIDTAEEISFELLSFLMDKFYLPCKIWILLNEHFSWSREKEELYEKFPDNFINFVMANINNKFRFRYNLFKKDIEIDYDSFIRYYYSACSELRRNNIYNTRNLIDKALQIYSLHPDIRILDGRYYLATNNLDKAVEIFSKIIEEDEKDFEAYLNRGDGLFRLGKVKEAYEDYDKVIKLNPDNMDAIYGLAECCFSLRNFEEARELYNILNDKYSYNAEIEDKFISSNYYLIDQYERKLKYNKEDLDYRYKLARCYFTLGEFKKCYELIKDIDKNSNVDFKMYLLLGNTLKILKEEERALAYIDKSIELNPNNWEVYYFKGLLFHDMNKYEEALVLYDKGIAVNDRQAFLYNNKGNVLCELKRFNEAIDACNRAIKLNPGLAHAYNNKAWALLELGLHEDALTACDIALGIVPHFAGPYINKAKIFYRLRKYIDVIDVCNKALEMRIEDSKLYYYKAMAAEELDHVKGI